MKITKLLILVSAFFITVAVVLNLLNVLEAGISKTGVYVEVFVLFLLMCTIVNMHFYDKKNKPGKNC